MNTRMKTGRYGPTNRRSNTASSLGFAPNQKMMKLENQNQNHRSDKANNSLPSPQN